MGNAAWMERYRGFIRGKTRIGLAWVGAIALVISARDYPTWPGVMICFLGATIRFWSSGYLIKDTELSRVGPYAYTRNPLYLGTFLMAVGTAVSIENLFLTAIIGALFMGVYHFIIMDEEEKLENKFGAAFEAYKREVPRFWPSFSRLKAPSKSAEQPFSFSLALKNKAFEAYYSFAFLIGLVTLIAWIYQRSIQF